MSVVVIDGDELRQIIREELDRALQSGASQAGPGLPSAMNVKEAAEFLGIGINKMYDMTRRRGFPAIRDGNRILIPRGSLVRWMEQEAFANPGGQECVEQKRMAR